MIIDDLRSGTRLLGSNQEPYLTTNDVDQIIIADPTVIRIDNVVQYFYQNVYKDINYEWNLVRDIPNFAPVFKEAWFEWKMPNHFKITERGAVYMKYQHMFGMWIYNIVVFIQTPKGILGLKDLVLVANEDGTLNQDCLRGVSYNSEITTLIKFSILFAGLATSFLHCKNVKKLENNPPPKLQKSRIRNKKPPLVKHYTLEVVPMSNRKQSVSKGNAEPSQGVSLHICRGHFKNYAEGNGLFGKYHGLYWWEDHIKGSKEVGEVKKQYSIKL